MMDPTPITPAAVASEIRVRLGRGEHPVGILAWLTGFMGFRWSRDCEPQQLRGMGIGCSCTAGPGNLLANWCAAVDRRSARLTETKSEKETR